jgi:hypothetical protein
MRKTVREWATLVEYLEERGEDDTNNNRHGDASDKWDVCLRIEVAIDGRAMEEEVDVQVSPQEIRG